MHYKKDTVHDGFRKGGMQDIWDSGRGMQNNKDSRQEGRSKGGIQDWKNSGPDGYMIRGNQDWRDLGLEGYRK